MEHNPYEPPKTASAPPPLPPRPVSPLTCLFWSVVTAILMGIITWLGCFY